MDDRGAHSEPASRSEGDAPFWTRSARAAAPASPVDQAMAVIERTLHRLAEQETRPLLDAPPKAYRMRRIGSTPITVFPIVLGTSAFGRRTDDDAARAILAAYAEAGGNAIDVTDAVGDAHGATVVGDWMHVHRVRDRTVVFAEVGRDPALTGLGAATLSRSVDAMLARLRTDRIDVLTFAVDDRTTPLMETLTAASALVQSGKVRFLMAGAYSAERLIQARVLAGQMALPLFHAVSPVYNLIDRSVERGYADLVHAQRLALLPRSPLAGGFLAGAARTRAAIRRMRETDPARANAFAPALGRRGLRVLDQLTRVADDRGTSVAAVALAWLHTRPNVVAPIVTVDRPEEVARVAQAASLHLTRVEVTGFDRAAGL